MYMLKKECIIVEGFTFRIDSTLKCGELSWRCTSNRQKGKAKVRGDLDASKVLSGDLTHNHEVNARKTERNTPHCILFIRPIDTFFVAPLSCESAPM
jgi:hypothetical protein